MTTSTQTSLKVTFKSSSFSFKCAHDPGAWRRAARLAAAKARSYCLAIRPWTFGASLTPILLGTVLAYKYDATHPSFSPITLGLTLFIALSVHAAGNLVNSYYDFHTGFDLKRGPLARDRTLIDGLITPEQTVNLAGLLYLASCSALLLLSHISPARLEHLALVFFGGLSGSFLYTGGGVGLKYFVGLGDLVVILTFGPVCVLFAFLAQTGLGNSEQQRYYSSDSFKDLTLSELLASLLLYSMPLFFGTEAALHCNNALDACAPTSFLSTSVRASHSACDGPNGFIPLDDKDDHLHDDPSIRRRRGRNLSKSELDPPSRDEQTNRTFDPDLDKARTPSLVTFASMIGPTWSAHFYRGLLIAPYLLFAYFAATRTFWFLLPILTLRKAYRLLLRFGTSSGTLSGVGRLYNASEKTVKLNFEMGVFYILACYLAPPGSLYRNNTPM